MEQYINDLVTIASHFSPVFVGFFLHYGSGGENVVPLKQQTFGETQQRMENLIDIRT
jgi:hypothetical protein